MVRKDFVIGRAYSPIQLASKIMSSQFIELVDLLPDDLKANESETQMFLEGKLVVTPAQKSTVEIQDIINWVKTFPI